jgi:hypothetical protein
MLAGIRRKKMKAITKKELCSADLKTHLAKGYKNIPKGEKVEIIGLKFTNLYGEWVVVKYNDNRYYVSKKDLEIIEEKEE